MVRKVQLPYALLPMLSKDCRSPVRADPIKSLVLSNVHDYVPLYWAFIAFDERRGALVELYACRLAQ